MKKNYLQEVYSRIGGMIKMSIGKYGIFYLSANILGTGLYFLVQYIRLGNSIATENLLDGLILLGSVNFFLLLIVSPFIRFWEIPEEIYNEQREIIESYKPNQLNIRVEKNLSKAQQNENGDLVLHLSLDVINLEKRKIVELEAYLATIDQWTEYLQDGTVNGISTSHMGRLQWNDGSYQVDLKPSYHDYKKLSIAMLNCANKELRFFQEKTDRILSYQENARYKITVTLKGKLENDPEYRPYEYVTEFLCSPAHCVLDFRPNADGDPNLPDKLRDVL